MTRKNKYIQLYISVGLLIVFALWTLSVRLIDVQPVGPHGSAVGFAAVNCFFHDLTGVHMALYTITDWLGLVPFAFAAGFAFLGFAQWIERKKLLKVDRSILLLGGFYVAVIAVYVFFENCVVNYRPLLIAGVLEVSYPSSTTLLTMCVMPTAVMQLNGRIRNEILRRCAVFAITAFTGFMVIGRMISGVHWFTDIVGGVLLSAGLVLLYRALSISDGK